MRIAILFLSALICSFASYGQINLSNGLIAYYPFSGNFNDASGNGNHATSVNGTTLATDRWGHTNAAASFDGINDYLSVAAAPSITPGHRFSISFQFKSNIPAYQMLFSKSNYNGTSAPDNYQLAIGFNGYAFLGNDGLFFCSNHTNTCVTTAFLASNYTFGNIIVPDQWYCVAMTFDNGMKKVYINGALAAQTTLSGTPNNFSIDSCTGGTFRMGTWWAKDPVYYSGLIDEVRLYNRALTPLEADSLCSLRNFGDGDGGTLGISGLPETEPNLITFPNPAADQISVDLPLTGKSALVIRIFNAMGQLVLTSPAKSGTNVISIASLPAGLYYACLHGADRPVTGKFVKR